MDDKSIKSKKHTVTPDEKKNAEPSRRWFLGTLLTKSALGAMFVGLGSLPAWSRNLMHSSGTAYAQARRGVRAYGTTPKFIALYQNSPNGPQSCGGCVHFIGPNGCDLVRPPVSRRGWCRFFEGRRGRGGYAPRY